MAWVIVLTGVCLWFQREISLLKQDEQKQLHATEVRSKKEMI